MDSNKKMKSTDLDDEIEKRLERLQEQNISEAIALKKLLEGLDKIEKSNLEKGKKQQNVQKLTKGKK